MDQQDQQARAPSSVQQTSQSPPTKNVQESVASSSTSPQKSSNKLVLVLIIILILGLGIAAYFIFGQTSTQQTKDTSATPSTSTPVGDSVLYVGTDTATLFDVSGGNSSGLATRVLTETTSAHTISTALPDPEDNNIYQAWSTGLDGSKILLGTLTQDSQGGFSLSSKHTFARPRITSFEELRNFVIVSRELVDDNQIETTILQGEYPL